MQVLLWDRHVTDGSTSLSVQQISVNNRYMVRLDIPKKLHKQKSSCKNKNVHHKMFVLSLQPTI